MFEAEIPTCSLCRRQRALADADYPMDAYDYSPMQAITGQPLGWYSGSDGQMCPECLTTMMRNRS